MSAEHFLHGVCGIFSGDLWADGGDLQFARHDRLSFLGHEEFEIAASEVRRGRGLGNEANSRHHHSVVLRQHDPDIRMPRCPVRRVGAKDIIAEHEPPVGNTLEDGLAGGIELDASGTHGLDHIPDIAELLLVTCHEEEADAGALDVVGSDAAEDVGALALEVVDEFGTCGRWLFRRKTRFVIHKDGWLEGECVSGVAPVRPGGPTVAHRQVAALGIAIIAELDLQVHGGRKGEVRRFRSGVRLLDDAVVDLTGQHVFVAHRDIRIGPLETDDHRPGERLIERGIDYQRARIGVAGKGWKYDRRRKEQPGAKCKKKKRNQEPHESTMPHRVTVHKQGVAG
ncbi:hypothetical protein D9M72_419570 [compost metagenome]